MAGSCLTISNFLVGTSAYRGSKRRWREGTTSRDFLIMWTAYSLLSGFIYSKVKVYAWRLGLAVHCFTRLGCLVSFKMSLQSKSTYLLLAKL